RNAQKEHFLPRRKDAVCQNFRKQLRQPGPAGKDECSCGDRFTCDGPHFSKSLAAMRWKDGSLQILGAMMYGVLNQCLHGTARHKDAAPGFQRAPGCVVKTQLRPAAANVFCRELLTCNP